MAILFAEGLPRSGKSYETMAKQIIPWLKKGREVVAYIEGLETLECQQKIADVAGMPLERVQQLLFPLTREDMRPREEKRGAKVVQVDGAWIEKTRDNALHVYDEAQNWWPNRLKPTEALTQFVTEHGHRGITIILMGQSLMDVLALWRRRVDQKFTYLKLTAIGQDNRYRVTIHKGQGNDEFVKVKDSVSKYDPKYFGTYKSHTSADVDTDTYTDNRVNVLKSGAFKYGAIAVVDEHVALQVEAPRLGVEVVAADHREAVVEDRRLRVQDAPTVRVHLDAVLEHAPDDRARLRLPPA